MYTLWQRYRAIYICFLLYFCSRELLKNDFPGKKSSYSKNSSWEELREVAAVKAVEILRGFANSTRYLRSAIEVDNYRFDMVYRTNTGSNNLCGSYGYYVGTPDFTRWYFHLCKRWWLIRIYRLIIDSINGRFVLYRVKDNLIHYIVVSFYFMLLFYNLLNSLYS